MQTIYKIFLIRFIFPCIILLGSIACIICTDDGAEIQYTRKLINSCASLTEKIIKILKLIKIGVNFIF